MPPIGFLSPLFLAGLAALAVPVVLHLFRRRVEPVVPFSAVRLLRQVPIEQAKRRRLQDILLFALRVAALALLALAFARPYLATGEARTEAPVTAVFVDVSASLGQPARFARALELARSAIDEAPSGHAVALGRFDSRADLLVAPTADRAIVRAALETLAPSAAATSYTAALARASETVGTRGGRIVLVTDLQTAGWAGRPGSGLPPEVALETADVGPLPPNAGIVELERAPEGVRVAVRNSGPARALRLTLDTGGPPLATRELAARANAVEVATLTVTLPEEGSLRARVADEEGLAADNERWLVLDPQPARRVLVIVAPGQSRDGLYLASALSAMAAPRAFEVDVQPADRVSAETLADGRSVVAVLGTAGLDRRAGDRLRQFVEEGGGLFVAAGPALNVDLLAAALGDALPRIRVEPAAAAPLALAPADVRHPVFRVFAGKPGAFDPVRFDRVATVRGTTGSRVLARFDTGAPALVEGPLGRGRICVFASDVGNRWNDLALHPVFVPFAVETFTWLAGSLEAPHALVAGETGIPGTGRPGIVDWRAPAAPDAPARRVAVHGDPREFDPARDTAESFERRVVRRDGQAHGGQTVARRQEAEQGLWRYGLALMLISLVVESAIGRRG